MYSLIDGQIKKYLLQIKRNPSRNRIPQDARNTAPLITPESLVFDDVAAAVTVDANHTGVSPIVRAWANGQMEVQKTDLARRRPIALHCVDGKHILDPPLVPPRHPLGNNFHQTSLLDLVSTTRVAAATPPVIFGGGTHNVDHRVEDTGEGGGTSTVVRSGRRLLHDSWRLLRNGWCRLRDSSRHISGQSRDARLLATIHGHYLAVAAPAAPATMA